MIMKRVLVRVVLMLVVITGVQSNAYSVPPPPLAADQLRLNRIQDGGIRGDRSVIPDIIAILEYPSSIPKEVAGNRFDPFLQIDPFYTEIALRAAIRLHAVEALPQIERLITVKNPDVSAIARVTRARLLAEDAMKTVLDPKQKAGKQISLFYAEIEMTPADLNSALNSYNKPLVNSNGHEVVQVGWVKPIPIGVYALREIADMVYRGDSRNYLLLTAVTSLDFNADTPSSIKLGFARPTRVGRAEALVESLSYWKPGVQYDARARYIKRLATDEGSFAAQAAINKLQNMERHPQIYPDNSFYNLIDVVNDAGEKNQGARLEKIHDTRQKVASRLQTAIENLKSGHKKSLMRFN